MSIPHFQLQQSASHVEKSECDSTEWSASPKSFNKKPPSMNFLRSHYEQNNRNEKRKNLARTQKPGNDSGWNPIISTQSSGTSFILIVIRLRGEDPGIEQRANIYQLRMEELREVFGIGR